MSTVFMKQSTRHFRSLLDLSAGELRSILRRAAELKEMHTRGELHQPFVGKVLGMVFEKSSTRTRVSFESAMVQSGGGAIFLSPRDTHLGRGEPIEDTARIMSRMTDVIAIRTFSQETVNTFAAYSKAPVINALTDRFHPCQLLADLQTFMEFRGDIAGARVAWLGDGNNVCNSFMNAAALLGFDLVIASPPEYSPDEKLLRESGDNVTVCTEPTTAVKDADLVVTDVWASMGQEGESEERVRRLSAYRVSADLMAHAAGDALFMHCLPAHRGEEVTTEVLEGSQSVVWDEAENRLHAQKALLEFLLL